MYLTKISLPTLIPRIYVEVKHKEITKADQAIKPEMFKYHNNPRYILIQVKWTVFNF